MTAGELFTKYGSDKETRHRYGEAYDRLLAPYREAATAVLEVGIARGASLRAWRDFFPRADVWGVDHSSDLVEGEERIFCARADSRKADALAAVLGDLRFDVIVDDGDHHPDAQHATRDALWPYLKPGGLYVVEDVQWQESHQGFIEKGAEIVDCRHLPPRAHDSVLVVFRKD